MSTPNLPALRVRVGLAADDTSKDTEITLSWNQAFAVCETYCDRWFDFKDDEVERFVLSSRYSLLLKRYPLKEITYIQFDDGVPWETDTYTIAEDRAGIVLRGPAGTGVGWGYGNKPVTVKYAGGYQTLPVDLELAMMYAFDETWKASGASSGTVAVDAPVTKISVVGVGSVDFGETKTSSGGTRFASDVAPWGLLPVEATAILQRYMNHTVMGGA